MPRFRNGQWVKCSAERPEFAGAFRAVDGSAVGIYLAAGYEQASESLIAKYVALGREPPKKQPCEAAVFMQSAIGGVTLEVVSDGKLVNVKLTGLDIDLCEPITDRADIPPSRIAHLPPNWQPEV